MGAIVFPNPYTVYPDSPSARFIFFLVFWLLCLEKRKKKAKSRKEKKNRGDKVLKTQKNIQLLTSPIRPYLQRKIKRTLNY